MINTVKKTAVSTKNHLRRHRTKYAVAATFVACFAVHKHAVDEWVAFLEEKDIDPTEFFTPEYFEELNS